MTQPPAVSIVGMGRLGAPLGASIAAAGVRVIGVDVDFRKVQVINAARSPVWEPHVAELLRRHCDCISATSDVRAAVTSSDATLIVVPTPSTASGSFSLDNVLAAAREIGRAVSDLDRYHVVAVASTVTPGSMHGPIRSTLECESKKRVGTDLGLCYFPQFVALGSVVEDFRRPDLVLIGESDPVAGERLWELFSRVYANEPAVVRTNFSNAELIKISINTFVTARISFANMLSQICDRLPGADVKIVTSVMGLDTRIGGSYLHGGLPYGGPCFPRDNRALAMTADELGVMTPLPAAIDATNAATLCYMAEVVARHVRRDGRVGILGLSYKTGTDAVEASAAVALANRLADSPVFRVYVHDPVAARSARGALSASITLCSDAKACIDASDVVILMTPWQDYLDLPRAAWAGIGHTRVLIDCWRAMPWLDHIPGLKYVTLGRGPTIADAVRP